MYMEYLLANMTPSNKRNSFIHPANPYAASKASQEMIAKIYVDSFGLDIIQTRSFTHFGALSKRKFYIGKICKESNA